MSVKINNKLVFLHIPKTGGMWVRNILKTTSQEFQEIANYHNNHDRTIYYDRFGSGRALLNVLVGIGLKRLRFRNKNVDPLPNFCFVRNPFDWYQSLWDYTQRVYIGIENRKISIPKNSPVLPHYLGIIEPQKGESFNDYISRSLNESPGQLSYFYNQYDGKYTQYIGRTELLKDDLIKILRKYEICIPRASVGNSEKVNVSIDKPQWNQELKKSILHSEMASFIKFGYISQEQIFRLGINHTFNMSNKLISKNVLSSAVDELL